MQESCQSCCPHESAGIIKDAILIPQACSSDNSAGACSTYLSSKVHDSINLLLIEYMSHEISGLDVALYKLRRRCRQRQFVVLNIHSPGKFETAPGGRRPTLKFGLFSVLFKLFSVAQ